MRFPGALLVVLAAEVFFVQATLDGVLRPFRALLSWHEKVDKDDSGTKNIEAVHERPTVRPEVDYWLAVDTPNMSGSEPPALFEDFNTTALSEPPKVSSPVDSPDRESFTSTSATTTTPPSGHSTSVAPPRDPTTSVGASAPTTEAKNFHMVDLEIPGGESPDKETLPDVASFEPKKTLESADTEGEELVETADIGSKRLKAESPPTGTVIPHSSTVIPAFILTATPPTTITPETAVTAAFRETVSAARLTSEGSGTKSDRFRSIRHSAQSFVVQDVNDLFQSDD